MRHELLSTLFLQMEHANESWLNSSRDPISRRDISDGSISEFALCKDADSHYMYFWLREKTHLGTFGYSIVQVSSNDASAIIVSMPAQFINQTKAEEATEAFAMGRITRDLCIDAYRARGADCVSDIVLHKRNRSRTGSIEKYRKDEKTRTIPKQPEKQVEWLADWIANNMPAPNVAELAKRLTA